MKKKLSPHRITTEKAIRSGYRAALQRDGSHVGTFVDFKTLFHLSQMAKSNLTLKDFKNTLLEMSQQNFNIHLSRTPELMADKRYAIEGERGIYYYLQILKETE